MGYETLNEYGSQVGYQVWTVSDDTMILCVNEIWKPNKLSMWVMNINWILIQIRTKAIFDKVVESTKLKSKKNVRSLK